jgi:hypothetical protein
MMPHSASAANNQQCLAADIAMKGDGALGREEWNPKARRRRQVNTVR